MALGEKILQARQEAGLSQRRLCGEVITRNMLSQIEHGTAKPSMDTLRYLATRLGKPVSYFLEEDAVTLPNRDVIFRARQAMAAGEPENAWEALEAYRDPDPVFDPEQRMLRWQAGLQAAALAAEQGRGLYALEFLENLGPMPPILPESLLREKTLLLARIQGKNLAALVSQLPSLDEELILRAKAALEQGDGPRAAALLEAAEDRESPQWQYLRGDCWLLSGNWKGAAACFHRCEAQYPEQTAPKLEQCYRELGDYRQAYAYACRQRG